MNKKPLSLLTILGLALTFLVNCDPNYFGRFLTRNTKNTPDKTTETPIDVPDGGDPTLDYFTVDSTWPQNNAVNEVRPEILFIVDTSGSMQDEKDALKGALEGWLAQLQTAGVDNFCVDVMESSYSGATTGRLRAAGSNAKCLCTDNLTVPQIVTQFRENIDTLSFGGGSGEAGVLSLHNALNDPAKLGANQADGCFRGDHALAVIMMSDENDMGYTVRDPSDISSCTGNATRSDGSTVDLSTVDWDNSMIPTLDGTFVTSPSSATKYVSNSCNEARVRLQYYAEATPGTDGKYDNVITAESVADDLSDYNDSLPTFGTGLIYNTTTFTANSAESKGWGYFEFADAFNQDTANLATTASYSTNPTPFNTQMNVIADSLATTLALRYKFDLPSPVCPGQFDSVVVKVNGDVIPDTRWILNSLGTWVKFKSDFNWAAYGGTAAVVNIDYTRCE